MLVGMVKNPSLYNPVRHPERTRERRNVVFDQMLAAGMLTEQKLTRSKPSLSNWTSTEWTTKPARLHISAKNCGVCSAQNTLSRANMPRGKCRNIPTTLCNGPLTHCMDGWRKTPSLTAAATTYTMTDLRYTPLSTRGCSNMPRRPFRNTSVLSATCILPRKAWQQIRAIYRQPRRNQRDTPQPPYQGGYEANRALPGHETCRQQQGGNRRSLPYTPRHESIQLCWHSRHSDDPHGLAPLSQVIPAHRLHGHGSQTGAVKAYVGGPSFPFFQYDMVSTGRRQIGSTVKPFLYTYAMEEGSPLRHVLQYPASNHR